jgi:type IV pilus assembly protein PilN
MIQINLLPVRGQKRKEGARQFASIYLLTVALAVAVIGFLWISIDSQIGSRQRELEAVNQEVNKYAKFDKILQELTQRKELIDSKRKIITELQNDRDTVVRMLALLSIEIPPEKMWFDKLAQTGNSITIDGVAKSNEAIVEFMRNLESSPYIEKGSINLVQSKQFAISEMKLREFQLTYRFYQFSEVQKKLKM